MSNFTHKHILSKQIKTTFKEVVILNKLRCNLHTLITTVINEDLYLKWSLKNED